MRALVLAAMLSSTAAWAGRDLCAPDAKHHRAPVDLDVKDADVHDVLRLLADAAHINLVVSDEVSGKVTLRLKRVAWDQAACAVAGVQRLAMTLEDNILLVRPAAAAH